MIKTIDVNIIYHLWNRSYRPNFRDTTDSKKEQREISSRKRLFHILSIEHTQDPVSLEEIEKVR